MYEDSESYRFFVPSMQEDSLCIPEIGTGGEYEYQCWQAQVIKAVLLLLSCRRTPVKLPIERPLFIIHFS